MGEYSCEVKLALLYTSSTLLATVTTICSAVPWEHWREILDTCVDSRCGCILYSTSTFLFFQGGAIYVCHFVTFASVPIFIVSLCLACYHGYRVCLTPRSTESNVRRQIRNGDVAVVKPRSRELRRPICICWTPLAVLASIMTVLILSNAAVLTDGYYKTCKEYRKTVVKTTLVTSQLASVIYDRLSCTAIFDFMDYLEPVTRPFVRRDDIDYRRPHEERDFMRGDFINTALALNMAMVSAWFNYFVWVAIIVHNVILARLEGKRSHTHANN